MNDINNNSPILIFSNKTKILYLKRLVNSIFKVLPLFEDNDNKSPSWYLDSLIFDVYSSNDLMFDGELIDIIIKIHSINTQTIEHKFVRRAVLESIDIVNKIIKYLEEIKVGGI